MTYWSSRVYYHINQTEFYFSHIHRTYATENGTFFVPFYSFNDGNGNIEVKAFIQS